MYSCGVYETQKHGPMQLFSFGDASHLHFSPFFFMPFFISFSLLFTNNHSLSHQTCAPNKNKKNSRCCSNQHEQYWSTVSECSIMRFYSTVFSFLVNPCMMFFWKVGLSEQIYLLQSPYSKRLKYKYMRKPTCFPRTS